MTRLRQLITYLVNRRAAVDQARIMAMLWPEYTACEWLLWLGRN